MGATLEKFLEEPTTDVTPEAKKPKPVQRSRPNTDIELWLARNGPTNFSELTDLRQSLYHRRTHGSFRVSAHEGDRFTVTGRTSSLLIVSDKARHYLLWTLRKMIGTDRRR
jgi:hypothetical protein